MNELGMAGGGAEVQEPIDSNVPDGPLEERREDGTLQLSASFRGGCLEGPVSLYDAQGKLQQVVEYAQGVPHGEMVVYEKGRPQMRMHFRAGKQHGPATSYGPQGEVVSRSTWSDGRMDGAVSYFGPGERLVRSEEYRAGQLHGAVMDYHLSGAVRQKSQYVEDKLHGEQITMDEKGKVLMKVRFHEGVPVAVASPAAGDAKKAVRGARKPPVTLLDRLVKRVRGGLA